MEIDDHVEFLASLESDPKMFASVKALYDSDAGFAAYVDKISEGLNILAVIVPARGRTSSVSGAPLLSAGLYATGHSLSVGRGSARQAITPGSKLIIEKFKLASLADSSKSVYNRNWDRWALFAILFKVEPIPGSNFAFEAFIAGLAELSGSASVVCQTEAAVNHFFSLVGFPSPLKSSAMLKMLRSIRNVYSKPSVPRDPFTV
jgi:hypothetical protein